MAAVERRTSWRMVLALCPLCLCLASRRLQPRETATQPLCKAPGLCGTLHLPLYGVRGVPYSFGINIDATAELERRLLAELPAEPVDW